MTAPTLARGMRLIHLYTGVFIAPAVLFFALTGAFQTFSLHETTKGSDYKPPQWIVTLGQLHKKQTTVVPPPRPAAARTQPPEPKTREPRPEPPKESVRNLLPMKLYFLLVSVALFISTGTGIYMAYRFTRNKAAILSTLAGGILVPVLILIA